MKNLLIAALMVLSAPAMAQTTLTLSAPVTMTMTAEQPARPPRSVATWNASLRAYEGDVLRHIQNARDSHSAMFHLADAPEDEKRLAFHSSLLVERLLGCLVEALAEKGLEIYLRNDGSDWINTELANEMAIEAVNYFGDQTSLAWEEAIIREVVRVSVPPSRSADRLAAYAALKKTFAPLEITARGAQPVLTIGDEMPRTMMSGVAISEMSPKLDAPLVLEFRQFPPLLSEADGYIIRVDTPPETTIDGKVISYSHSNEAIYRVERFSAESGQPNPVSEVFVAMGRAESVSIPVFKAFRDNPTLRPGDVSRTLVGIRVTITREEADEEE